VRLKDTLCIGESDARARMMCFHRAFLRHRPPKLNECRQGDIPYDGEGVKQSEMYDIGYIYIVG
jgi:hypothetical protein